ncbi:hypothetical protein PVAND_004726 [Polypedilum vanderplanki]|uniref:Cytochrome P450 n=1 Tax=Polypedilum vanderplanki TaxID=319348 RepID=A0A9J6BYL4_POLVA|nr:hypothetical protein PVAND_004726 [Polypedilum vanderplanki]
MLRKLNFKVLINNAKFSTIAVPRVNDQNLDLKAAKPFHEIPKINRLKLIINYLPGGKYYKKGLNELHRSLSKEYGNIVIMPAMLGKPEIVFSYSDHDNETILLNEGNFPNRYSFEILKYFRETLRPDVYGGEYGSVASENGERWYKIRTIINQVMLPPKNVQQFVQPIDEISNEFIDFIRKRSNDTNDEILGKDINLWTLESMASVTLNKRLNLFNEKFIDPRARELIQCVRKFFIMTVDFELNPSIWKFYHTKAFKEYMEVNDKLLNTVLSFIEETMENMKNTTDNNQEVEGILQKLLKIDKRVAVIMASDSLFAGIDTTGSGTIGVLYCLAKNPEKQEKLRQEILKIFPNKDEPIDARKMANMPYIRSCIKEALRLFPPVSGTSRTIAKDLVLSGYQIPAGTVVVTWPQLFYRQEKFFPKSNEYIPERWLKESVKDCPHLQVEKFHFLPFGHGVRSCPGKRIANMEMEVLLINLLRKFKIEWHQDDMKVNSVLVNIPYGDIRFKLVEL